MLEAPQSFQKMRKSRQYYNISSSPICKTGMPKKWRVKDSEWGLRNLVQHIDCYDKYSRENDNCWIEEYDSKEDDSKEEEEETKKYIYILQNMKM